MTTLSNGNQGKGLLGFRFNRNFFDVKIFNPNAVFNPKTLKDAYKYHESIKRNKYEERNATQRLQRSGFGLLGRCWAISIANYAKARNQD